MKLVKPSGEERDVPRGVVGGTEISQATTGAHNIYMGIFRVPAGSRGRPHYHDNCESALYMLSGAIEIRFGDQLRGMASMLIPLGRTGTPEEAAGGVFFLCSPWSNFVHGQVLNITGGQFTGMTT